MGDVIGKKTIKREKITIIYKGVFHFKNLYEFMHNWIEEEGFQADNCQAGGDAWETFYWERRSPSGYTDYNIWWRLKMKPHNTWFTYKMSVDFLGLGIAKTETMHNGKKFGAYKGELDIFITPIIEFDLENKWKKGTIFDGFVKPFERRIYKKELKYHKDFLDNLSFRFQEELKQFFGLVTFSDKGEPFHPERGMGWG